jgi:uncharacterized SAM-binding protein YcdF (DUF218 family)
VTEALFLLRKLSIALVLPPTGPLLMTIAGLVLIKRAPRLGRALAWTGTLLLLALSQPIVSYGLQRLVDDSPPLDFAAAKDAQAIVVLGGGVRRNALEYGGDTLGRLTLERVRYGAYVAKRTGLPILVTGGVVLGGQPEAVLMSRSLAEEFGVKVRWVEARSRDTHENARFSAEMLKKDAVKRVVLVAHTFDMPRASAEILSQGLEVVRAPTGLSGTTIDSAIQWVPGLGALEGSHFALYELLAGAAQRAGLLR